MDLCTISRLLFIYVVTIHKLKCVNCSDNNPDDKKDLGDKDQISDQNPNDTDKGHKRENELDQVDETRVAEQRKLILKGKKPTNLDLKSTNSTDQYDYNDDGNIVTFTAKEGYCFNIFCHNQHSICVFNAICCAHKVTVLTRGESVAMAIHSVDGATRIFNKENKSNGWNYVTSESHESVINSHRYEVKVLCLQALKVLVRALKNALDRLEEDAANDGDFEVVSQAFVVTGVIQKLIILKTIEETEIQVFCLIKEFLMLERDIYALPIDKREVLSESYHKLKEAFGELFKTLEIYQLDHEPDKPEEPETESDPEPEPQETKVFELELESDDESERAKKKLSIKSIWEKFVNWIVFGRSYHKPVPTEELDKPTEPGQIELEIEDEDEGPNPKPKRKPRLRLTKKSPVKKPSKIYVEKPSLRPEKSEDKSDSKSIWKRFKKGTGTKKADHKPVPTYEPDDYEEPEYIELEIEEDDEDKPN